jgi:peptidoglycan/LPS O-acetylase OafA/YrhL
MATSRSSREWRTSLLAAVCVAALVAVAIFATWFVERWKAHLYADAIYDRLHQEQTK